MSTNKNRSDANKSKYLNWSLIFFYLKRFWWFLPLIIILILFSSRGDIVHNCVSFQTEVIEFDEIVEKANQGEKLRQSQFGGECKIDHIITLKKKPKDASDLLDLWEAFDRYNYIHKIRLEDFIDQYYLEFIGESKKAKILSYFD